MRCVEEEGYVYSEVGDAVNSLLNDNVDPQRIRVPSIAAVDNQSRDTTAIRRVPEVAVDTVIIFYRAINIHLVFN